MNIKHHELQSYIEVFHECLDETASRYLDSKYQKDLLHTSLLPARIRGYVSTKFGVAIEYKPAASTSIEVCRGSARVEDLLVQAPARLKNATGGGIAILGPNTSLTDIRIRDAFPFRLMTREASVRVRSLVVKSGVWARKIEYAEVFGDRRTGKWTSEHAVSRAKDEVLAAIVESNKATCNKVSINEYVSRFKKKSVLVLGGYSVDGDSRLRKICDALHAEGYDSILVKDIPDHPHHDLRQKVTAIGAVARFVVVDDTERSGHIMELQICDTNNWITLVLRPGDRSSTWMTEGLSEKSKVIQEYKYDPSTPDINLKDAISWAESTISQLQRNYERIYPWRRFDK